MTKKLKIKSGPKPKKPPLGLRPRWVFQEHRLIEVMEACLRCLEGGERIPAEWLFELSSLSLDLEAIGKSR